MSPLFLRLFHVMLCYIMSNDFPWLTHFSAFIVCHVTHLFFCIHIISLTHFSAFILCRSPIFLRSCHVNHPFCLHSYHVTRLFSFFLVMSLTHFSAFMSASWNSGQMTSRPLRLPSCDPTTDAATDAALRSTGKKG